MTVKEISLTPYPGRVFVCTTWKELTAKYLELFKVDCPHSNDNDNGTMIRNYTKEAGQVFLVWARDVSTLAHELSHVCLDIFEQISSDPREGSGEPFCYLMGKLMKEAKS